MGTKKKSKENDLANQQSMWSNAAYQQYLKSLEPSELEKRLSADALQFLDDTSGKNGPMDITKVQGMSPYLDLFNRAKSRGGEERYGTGALALAGENSGGWGKLLKQHSQMRREEEAGGQLSNAFAMRNAEVRGSALPLANMYNQRNQAGAQTALGGMGQAGNTWMGFRQTQKQPFWQQLLMGGMQAAGGMASAYMGNPSNSGI